MAALVEFSQFAQKCLSLALQGAASWSTQYAPYLLLGAAAKYWT